MSKEDIVDHNALASDESDAILELKRLTESSSESKILCKSKKSNPNYLSIISANKSFYELFSLEDSAVIGKSYDFLFLGADLDYSSDDHIEYIRLIKSVKDFHACSIIISTTNHEAESSGMKIKVSFSPSNFVDEEGCHYAAFTFDEIDHVHFAKKEDALDKNTSSSRLLKNLERTLRNERILREVGSLIILDMPMNEVAQKIAKILCQYLKADRCLLHDYSEGKTNFVVEYSDSEALPMINGVEDPSKLRLVAEYINFQNHFFERQGNRNKRSSLVVVEDVHADDNFNDISAICDKFSIASEIAITTTFGGNVNGGIYIHQSDKKRWLADELELLEVISDQFSMTIDRSSSIERVMVTNHALIEKTAQLKESLKTEQEMRQMQNEFVALVSHEFKTPLQIIDSTRELITRKVKSHNVSDPSLNKLFDRIRNGVQRMNGLITTTLNLAKMESGDGKIKLEPAQFDLKNFVLDIIEKNSDLSANKKINVVAKVDALPTDFIGDSKLLDHAITNVISNAIKYSGNETMVKILAKSTDKKVAIKIIDQGMGIPKEDLSSIGKKFFRAKNTLSVAGTGIGVYLTKSFIELHGGTMSIDSQVGVGTSVTIILPRTQ